MLRRCSRRDRSRQEGAAATEFVLIAPILVVIFFGIVYVGLAVYRTQVIESAAREGARVASLGGDTTEVESAVCSGAFGFDCTNELTISADLCTALDDDAVVSVSASGSRLNYTIPFLGSYTPTFTASATFECEKMV